MSVMAMLQQLPIFSGATQLPNTRQMVIVMLSNEEQIACQSHVYFQPGMPGGTRKVIGSETGQQFDLAFAGCAEIAEDGPDLLGVMFKFDVLVWSWSQRLRSGLVFLQATPVDLLRVEQVTRILLNRPFSAVL